MSASAGDAVRPGATAALRLPAFRRLAIGATISRFGNGLATVALAFAMLDLTHSVPALGLVVAARSAANVALLLVGGALADRLPRRPLLVGSALVSGAAQLAIGGVVAAHLDLVAARRGLAAVNGAAARVAQPLATALVPQTLTADLLQEGSTLFRIGTNTASLVGTAVAGVGVAALGSAPVVGIDGVTFLLAALAWSGLRVERLRAIDAHVPVHRHRRRLARVPHPPMAVDGRRRLHDRERRLRRRGQRARPGLRRPLARPHRMGLRTRGDHRRIRARRARRAARPPEAPPGRRRLLRRAVRRDPRAPRADPRARRCSSWRCCSIGVLTELFEVLWQVEQQRRVPAELLARVTSYDLLGSFLAIPIGQALAAPIASVVGLQPALLGAGVIGVVALASCLLVKDVRAPSPAPSRTGNAEGRLPSGEPPF